MADDQEIKRKFWKALDKDMTVMLGLAQGEAGHVRPMTAHLEEDKLEDDDYAGAIWFFTATDNALYEMAGAGSSGVLHFVSKGHDVWAAVNGTLSPSQDRVMIDKLWNRFVAAWYEGGKDDPKLALLRFDPRDAEIWIDASSAVAGLRLLLGIDPKKDYADKVAEVSL